MIGSEQLARVEQLFAGRSGRGLDDAAGFDLVGGWGNKADVDGDKGLTLQSVAQLTDGACADGNCGPVIATPAPVPCDNNAGGGAFTGAFTVPINQTEVVGFTPVE